MALSDYSPDFQPSAAEIITEIGSLPGVRKFEYDARNGFLHAEVDREIAQPYQIVQKIEDLGISADDLFIFLPKSPGVDYTQHLRYSARMKSFLHSNGDEVDAVKIKMAA